MQTPLALRNLLHDRRATFAAMAGVSFALVLIFLQLGFFDALRRTAVIIFRQLEFDVLVTSVEYLNFQASGRFPRERLAQIESSSGVKSAEPVYIGTAVWRSLESPAQQAAEEARLAAERVGWAAVTAGLKRPANYAGKRKMILVVGLAPSVDGPPVKLAAVRGAAEELSVPGRFLMDELSHVDFGPKTVGRSTIEIQNQRAQIAGVFRNGTGFSADGAVIAGAPTFAQWFGRRSLEQPNIGLVSVQPGVDPEKAAADLNERLPFDVHAVSRREAEDREATFWVRRTAVGAVFSLGVVVALIVGVVVVTQVLVSDVDRNRREYATLKAMGYTDRYLAGVVVAEGLMLAAAGYVPALAVSAVLYEATRLGANLPMQLTWERCLQVLLLSAGMCIVAALASIRRIQKADPAELF
ncbi:MAG: ABC transporter permease [Planctomycetia bacterium]